MCLPVDLLPIGNIGGFLLGIVTDRELLRSKLPNVPDRELFLLKTAESPIILIGNISLAGPVKQAQKKQGIEGSAHDYAARFGALVREHREALRLRQEDIVFATGVGRRFIVELESGKPSCQLGKALVVAAAVGLRPFDLMGQNIGDDNALLPDLPDAADEPSRG